MPNGRRTTQALKFETGRIEYRSVGPASRNPPTQESNPTMKKYLKISSAVIVAILVIAGIAGASSKKTSKTSVSTPTT